MRSLHLIQPTDDQRPDVTAQIQQMAEKNSIIQVNQPEKNSVIQVIKVNQP
ncbi:hypothetical protein DPMN_131791 [Dreissena polymorpha]|uniref:Uncharacterized protein n=1 Tax=Dreissena polymorpha TaxID=45954 RepID=A0A9D4FR85_DREPO|nr:hypothetical protein DPMN_131791 [Dreissena polymorpha]